MHSIYKFSIALVFMLNVGIFSTTHIFFGAAQIDLELHILCSRTLKKP